MSDAAITRILSKKRLHPWNKHRTTTTKRVGGAVTQRFANPYT